MSQHVNRLLWCLGFVALSSGCLFVRSGPVLPTKNHTDRGQLIIHSDFDLPDRHRLLEHLHLVRETVYQKLALPPGETPVRVYLFESPERLSEYLEDHYPGLPTRRAFFLATESDLLVFAHWGDQVIEDLRHEVTHGFLHAVLPDLPLWLDEGLAEYFEVGPDRRGYHREHIQLLLELHERGEWKPDLVRLERLQTLDDMTLLDYAESWLWVHAMMESAPERMDWLRRQLSLLRQHRQARPLSQKWAAAEEAPQQVLIAHLKSLAELR